MLTRNDRDISIEKDKLKQAMDKYNEDMQDYNNTKSIESLKSALTNVYKIINPSYDYLRKLEYDTYHIEYNEIDNEYIVHNEMISLQNQEIIKLGSKIPKMLDGEK